MESQRLAEGMEITWGFFLTAGTVLPHTAPPLEKGKDTWVQCTQQNFNHMIMPQGRDGTEKRRLAGTKPVNSTDPSVYGESVDATINHHSQQRVVCPTRVTGKTLQVGNEGNTRRALRGGDCGEPAAKR